MNERLRQARLRAGFKSARSAALRYGWNVSTYAAHENGQNSLSPYAALMYATTFRVDPSWLTFGVKHAVFDAAASFTPVVGEIGGNGFIQLYGDFDENPRLSFSEVSSPVYCISFLVRGTGMWPRFNENDLIICEEYSNVQEHSFNEEEAVVQTKNDLMIRTVSKLNVADEFSFRMHNVPPSTVKGVERAWGIWMILPQLRWSLVERNSSSWDANVPILKEKVRAMALGVG